MIVTTKELFKHVHGKYAFGAYNIDADGRLVWCRVHREEFIKNPENFDLRPPGKVFMAEYAKYIAHKNTVLGSAGQLDSVRTRLKK